ILAVLGLLLVPQISGYIDQSKASVGAANAKACYSNEVARRTAAEAKLSITVTKMTGCTYNDDVDTLSTLTTATWTDSSSNAYVYTASTGAVTGPGIK
ncbi:hypothetical protein, partial [Anaerorhabdus sp.]